MKLLALLTALFAPAPAVTVDLCAPAGGSYVQPGQVPLGAPRLLDCDIVHDGVPEDTAFVVIEYEIREPGRTLPWMRGFGILDDLAPTSRRQAFSVLPSTEGYRLYAGDAERLATLEVHVVNVELLSARDETRLAELAGLVQRAH
jgi:hypothetical protein